MLVRTIAFLTLLIVVVHTFRLNTKFSNKIIPKFVTKEEGRWSSSNTKLRAVAIEPAGSRSPADRPLSWKRNGNKESGSVLDYNWKYGVCQHKVPFEGAQNIRKFKFCGDLLSFGLIDGKLVVIRLSSGEILDKFNEHSGEISAIDFDGLHLASGGADGTLCFYDLTYKSPKTFGAAKHKFAQLHSKAITGVKIMRTMVRSKTTGQLDEELIQILTVGLDKKLVCTNYHT